MSHEPALAVTDALKSRVGFLRIRLTVADGSPFVGVSAFFPSYAPRAGRIITLEDRINGCFKRSMNG